MFDTYIHNATILTMDEAFHTIAAGAVGIADGKIETIHARPSDQPLPEATDYFDVQGAIVMPGLINSHTHLPMSLYRGLADDLPLEQWLQEHMFPVEARFSTAENIPWAVGLSCAEMLLGGITTCCDGYFWADRIAETVSDIGLRAVLAQGVIDFPAPGVPDPAENIAVAKAFTHRWRSTSPDTSQLVTPSIFCHAPYTCSAETLIAARQAADETGVLFQIHVAETQTEVENCRKEHGCSPIAYLQRLGLLNANTLLVHAVWVDDADIEIIAKSQAAVAHCPESNMKLASGIAPIPEIINAGIRVGLGTDSSASNNDLDMFREMDITAKLHKINTMDPTTMDACTVLDMATRTGARAIGLGDRIGSLAPGNRADLIVLAPNLPHLTPIYHPASHLVYAAAAADVRHVMVDGRWVVRDKALLTIDLEEVLFQVNRIAAQIKGSRI
jgi:5-methylthioadenosine/S-adenosylhomocysteine deaminase